jgi:NTE family protein
MSDSGPARVAIACQGGGSHTAFTAGVLGGILRALAPKGAGPTAGVEVVALSGTSGGAMCALLAWDGLLRDDPERGAAQLDAFWRDNAANDPWSALLNTSIQLALQVRNFVPFPEVSPYVLPSWGQQQLRAMLERRVNFRELRALAQRPGAPGLVIGAVEVRSAAFDVFHGPEVSVECLLASAALPNLFPAVPVPGRGVYWDGLFSQNPPIRELTDYRPDELWVVQINPSTCMEVPTTLDAIHDRRNELAGNLALEQELRFIAKINELLGEGRLAGSKYRPITVSRITMKRDLGFASKLDRSPGFLSNLMAYGEAEAKRFLEERRQNLRPRLGRHAQANGA